MTRGAVPRWLAGALITASFIAVAIGYISDRIFRHWLPDHPVTANLLASVLGLPMSFLVALFVVDRLLENERRRRWGNVTEQAVRPVIDELQRVRSNLDNTIRSTSEVDKVHHAFEILSSLESWHRWCRYHAIELDDPDSLLPLPPLPADAADTLREARWTMHPSKGYLPDLPKLDRLRDPLLPGLEVIEDPDVVHSVREYLDAAAKWATAVNERDKDPIRNDRALEALDRRADSLRRGLFDVSQPSTTFQSIETAFGAGDHAIVLFEWLQVQYSQRDLIASGEHLLNGLREHAPKDMQLPR
jgi:hypothetical protein